MELYKRKPIQSLESLACALRVSKDLLLKVIQRPDKYYREFYMKNRKLYSIKYPLKSIQKKIKIHILDYAKYPNFVYGGIPGRSATDCAQIHLGKIILIKTDIKNFFPSVTDQKINELWRYHFNFSKEVSQILTQLTTYKKELPQGSSTSAHLANLVLIAGGYEHILYEELKASGCEYTRYMDDIEISFTKNISPRKKTEIIQKVIRFVKSKRLKINYKKTGIQGSQKQKNMLGYTLGRKNLKKSKEYIRELIEDSKRGNISTQSLIGKLQHIGYVDPKRERKIRKIIDINTI